VINKVSEFKQSLADRTSVRFHISVQCKSAAYHGVLGIPSKAVTTRSKDQHCNHLEGGGGHKNWQKAPESSILLQLCCMSNLQGLHHITRRQAGRADSQGFEFWRTPSDVMYLLKGHWEQGVLVNCWSNPPDLLLTHLIVLVIMAP
jgi:hypothetical protein